MKKYFTFKMKMEKLLNLGCFFKTEKGYEYVPYTSDTFEFEKISAECDLADFVDIILRFC